MDKIPIQNIYYIVLYAFDAIKSKNIISKKDLEKTESFVDVIVKLFVYEVEKIIKYGIHRDYNEIEEESIFIKGKLNVQRSILQTNNKSICTFDEFNSNETCNKIIKYTLNKLLFANDIKEETKKNIKSKYFAFDAVDLEEFDFKEIKQVKLNRLNKHYELALKLALFLNFNLIPKDEKKNFDFLHILKDEEIMSMIYEKFLYKFYDVNLVSSRYLVKSGSAFKWELERIDEGESNLPEMQTDIEIRHKDNNSLIVIDAKYYQKAFSERYKTRKMLSPNMYQMSAYLNYYEKDNKNYPIRGILLYPANGYQFHERYQKEDSYTLEFATIDLNQDWDKIEEGLLNIIDENLTAKISKD